MVQESIEKYRFIRLNENNVVESFDCGDQDLNDFILNRSAAYQKYLLSVSYAFANPDNGKILAYCSLANDKVAVTDFKDKTEFNRFRRHHGFPNAKRLKSYPAVKLCRLGVDTSAKGKQGRMSISDGGCLPRGGSFLHQERFPVHECRRHGPSHPHDVF